MKRNLVPLLGIAFVVAVASTGIFYGLFVGKLKSTSSPPPKFTVVSAARPLTPGTILSEEHLKTTPWPGESVPKGLVTSVDQVLGRAVLQNIEGGEPLLLTKVVAVNPAIDGEGVPSGLRAVSVHVSDSSGVLKMLQPGHKVDVQVVQLKGEANRESEARTVLEGVTVLGAGTQPEPTTTGHLMAPVVTLLVRPRDAEMLAVADSAARIRLTLRNPLDEGRIGRSGLSLPAVLNGAVSSMPAPAERGSRNAPAQISSHVSSGPRVSLSIRLAGAASSAWEELGVALGEPRYSGALQVSSFRGASEAETALARLQDKNLLEIVSETRLEARPNRVVSVRNEAGKAGETDCALKIRFVPYLAAGGRMRLRVLPEVTTMAGSSHGVRAAETDVEIADGQPFLVSGLLPSADRATLWNRLFPGKAKDISGRDLVVVVSPRLIAGN
jgi:Flp pilus assembly protein CpaB